MKGGRAAKANGKARGSSVATRASGRGRGRRNGAGRAPQIAVAAGLAVAGFLFIPILVESAVPPLSSLRTSLQKQIGLGSYVAPVLLLGLAGLVVLSLRRRGFRLHWTRAVGWVAFFIGILGMLHRFGGLREEAPSVEAAGGAVGRAAFEALAGLFGPVLAVLLLFLLTLAGAAAGVGIPLHYYRAAARGLRRLVRWLVRAYRRSLPLARRALRLARLAVQGLLRVGRRAHLYARRWTGRVWAAARAAVVRLWQRLRPLPPPPPVPEPVAALPTQPRKDAPAAPAKPAAGASVPAGPAADQRASVRPNGNGEGWQLPPLSLLQVGAEPEVNPVDDEERLKALERIIEKTLGDFGVPVKVVERRPGPAVTQFGVEPQFHEKRARDGTILRREKVKVREITARANDLALALAARSIRIEAPVPGRPVVGIEVPNQATAVVTLRSELESRPFQRALAKYALPIVLGRDVSGEVITADLARMPHLLIAGATGSGKSVCVNSIVATLLMNHTPDDLRFLMIDPKRVEMTLFDAIPHLLRPVVVDVDKAVPALFQAVTEMDHRYREFAAVGVRNIEGYNRLAARGGEHKRLPYVVIVIDELADLMMLAADEVERTLCRLAQLARATGIHLVVATQRPSVDVVTGLIKANFPTRISFMVTSQVDSRTILDTAGAEKLLGRGDMLYLPSDAPKPLRLQGTYLSDEEIEDLTGFWRAQRAAQYAPEFVDLPTWTPGGADEADELYERAVELAHEHGSISASFLQRRLRIGWNRAARLMEMLEENGELPGEREEAQGPGDVQEADA